MDRAHRLGQTKKVTVYRLICKGTVEEKIMQRASQKNTVQQLVITGNTASQGDVLEAEEVVSLLLDVTEMEAKIKEQVPSKQGMQTYLSQLIFSFCNAWIPMLQLDLLEKSQRISTVATNK